MSSLPTSIGHTTAKPALELLKNAGHLFGDASNLLTRLDNRSWTPPDPSTDVLPGIRLSALLGSGGMGSVYAATELATGQPLAIKFLPPELSADRYFVARFHKEARALAKLNHPNIVRILDHGETTEGDLYIAMEKLEGQTLAKRLATGPIARPEACRILSEICLALEYAHAQGILHGDIKPSNIFLSPTNSVTLLDFGLATACHRPGTENPGLTRTVKKDGSKDFSRLSHLAYDMALGRNTEGLTDSTVTSGGL